MAKIIKYPATCFKCKKVFEAGKAYLHRLNGKWLCHCFGCYKKDKRK